MYFIYLCNFRISLGSYSMSDGHHLDSRATEPGIAGLDLSLVRCFSSLDLSKSQDHTLESLFRLFDSGSKGYLDAGEVGAIIDQMVQVAESLDWDTSQLRQILTELMHRADAKGDGRIRLDDWLRCGNSGLPILPLLGLDASVKDDGSHEWQLCRFVSDRHCNACLKQLSGLNRLGLRCVLCRYTIHDKCVARAPASCISTYVKSRPQRLPLQHRHHWTEGNCSGARCASCRRTVGRSVANLRCRWCQICLHARCADQLPDQPCDLGQLRRQVLPPAAVYPAVLDGRPTSLTFRLAPPPDCEPLLVFVNPKSGGRQGARVLRKLRYLLNPRQVCDLISDAGPKRGLSLFHQLERFRVLVCGGDGTAGWVLEAIDAFDWPAGRPPVAVLPLGTGNDLARCLGWGGGYDGEPLEGILQRVGAGPAVLLDRWRIDFSAVESEVGQPPVGIVNNYFSIGVDAAIAHRWHLRRERHPKRFNSRLRNKLYYAGVGAAELLGATCKHLQRDLDIVCDGRALNLADGPPLEGVAVLNIATVYGGRSLWSGGGSGRFARQDMGDGLLELVGLDGAVHAGLVAGGFPSSGRRLAQCSEIVIRTRRTFAMQIDGEPWRQPASTISIRLAGQAALVAAPPPDRSAGGLGRLLCHRGGERPD